MLFFGAILLSLAAAEIMIGFFSYDLHYGGITFQRDYEVHNYEFNYTVHLNSDGFRDDEFRKKKEEGTTRVLLIGDSFVFGLGVGGNETIDKLLEKRLSSRSLSRHGKPSRKLARRSWFPHFLRGTMMQPRKSRGAFKKKGLRSASPLQANLITKSVSFSALCENGRSAGFMD